MAQPSFRLRQKANAVHEYNPLAAPPQIVTQRWATYTHVLTM